MTIFMSGKWDVSRRGDIVCIRVFLVKDQSASHCKPTRPQKYQNQFHSIFFLGRCNIIMNRFFLAIRSRDRHGAAVHGPKDG